MASSDYVTQAEVVQAVATVETAVNELLAGLEVLQPETSDYVTNAEMVTYVTNCVDTWGTLLWDILVELTRLVDEINGEVVLENLVKKMQYLYHTKELIRDKIISTGSGMPYNETFRNYPKWIKGISGDWILKTVAIVKKSKPVIEVSNFLANIGEYLQKIVTVVYKAGKKIYGRKDIPMNDIPIQSASVREKGTKPKVAATINIAYPEINIVPSKEVN